MRKHEIGLQITRPITFTTWSPINELNPKEQTKTIIREFAIWLLNNLDNVDYSKFKMSVQEIDTREE